MMQYVWCDDDDHCDDKSDHDNDTHAWSSGVAHPFSVDVDIWTDNSYLIPSVIRIVGILCLSSCLSWQPLLSFFCPVFRLEGSDWIWSSLCNINVCGCVYVCVTWPVCVAFRWRETECNKAPCKSSKVWDEVRKVCPALSVYLTDWSGAPCRPVWPWPDALACFKDVRLVHLAAISCPAVEMPLQSY